MIVYHPGINIYNSGIFEYTLPHYVYHKCILLDVIVMFIRQGFVILKLDLSIGATKPGFHKLKFNSFNL